MNPLDAGLEPRKARVEIIPLIDVVFFLLATFVLFTLSLQKIQLFDVRLPEAGGESDKQDMTVYIQASESGTFYWKRGQDAPELISTAEIRPKLVTYRRETDSPRVLIRSDVKAKFGDAVLVLDEVRRAGITAVSFETVTSATGR